MTRAAWTIAGGKAVGASFVSVRCTSLVLNPAKHYLDPAEPFVVALAVLRGFLALLAGKDTGAYPFVVQTCSIQVGVMGTVTQQPTIIPAKTPLWFHRFQRLSSVLRGPKSARVSRHRKALQLMKITTLSTRQLSKCGMPWDLGKKGSRRAICAPLNQKRSDMITARF